VFSDGTLTPTELIDQAEALGLGAIALTDHNTVLGLPEFLEAAKGKRVKAISGVEFSVEYGPQELHILALFIQPEHYDAAMAIADEMQENKRISNIALVDALNKAGYAISYDKIKADMPAGEPNRALIAAELTRCGYVQSNQEAFQKLLAPKHGYYVPPKRIEAMKLIRFVRSIGAVSVWAHPFLHLKTEEAVREFLPKAVEAGLMGMETRYPLYTPEQTAWADQLAKEYNLLPSGGSDFHGENKPDISLGTGKGNLAVPLEWAIRLEETL
jgi:predicted metal-dependent phosphoesterase TrpH